jgi:hypothetical protein
MTPSLPRRFGALAFVVWGAFAGGAHAQSSLRLSVLKPASTDVLQTAGGWAIDATGQVVGTAAYSAGYTFGTTSSFTPGWIPVFKPYMTRWPAGTAASVAGSKLSTTVGFMEAASPNGQKVLSPSATGHALFDTVSKKTLGKVPLAPQSSTISSTTQAVSNTGTVVVNVYGSVAGESPYLTHASSWSVSQGLKALPETGYVGSAAHAINASGVVAGAVSTASNQLHQAALWVNGQLQVIPQSAGTASLAFQVNDKGQALVRRARLEGSCATVPDVGICETGASTVSLRDGSAETALLAAGDARTIARALLNNAGVVVGRYELADAPRARDVYPQAILGRAEVGRAFIWQAGVFSELTTWVSTKGVTLPAGSVLTDVLAINDQGSMVVQMVGPNNVASIVRLVAAP